MTFDVVVIGGGFAGPERRRRARRGAAPACSCSRRGPSLGGRATAFTDPATGERRRQRPARAARLLPRDVRVPRARSARATVSRSSRASRCRSSTRRARCRRCACPPLPSPLHLLAGVLEWDALAWRDRLSALRLAAPLRRAQRFLRTGQGLAAGVGRRNGRELADPQRPDAAAARDAVGAAGARRAQPAAARRGRAAPSRASWRRCSAPTRATAAIARPAPAAARRCTRSRRARSSKRAAGRCAPRARRGSCLDGDRALDGVECRRRRGSTPPASSSAVPWFALADVFAGDVRGRCADVLAAARPHGARRRS